MTRANPLADPPTIISFGKNVFACCDIVGLPIVSLGIRTDIKPAVFSDYQAGTRELSQGDIDAVASEFQLTPLQLTSNYGSEERRKERLSALLLSAGRIKVSEQEPPKQEEVTPEPELPATVEPEPVEALEDVVVIEEVSAGTDAGSSIVEDAMSENTVAVTGVSAITWDEDDVVASTALGEKFDLQPKAIRAAIIGRVREVLARNEETFTSMNNRAMLNKSSGWWSNVEKGLSRIYGNDVKAIAAALGVNDYWLLTGKDASGDALVQPEVLTPDSELEPEPDPSPEPPIVEPKVSPTPPEPPVPAVLEAAADPVLPETGTAAEVEPVSADASEQQFFRSLIFSETTEPAEGVTVGQLLVLARDQEGVDWVSTYLTLTAAGQALSGALLSVKGIVAAYDVPIRRMFQNALAELDGNAAGES